MKLGQDNHLCFSPPAHDLSDRQIHSPRRRLQKSDGRPRARRRRAPHLEFIYDDLAARQSWRSVKPRHRNPSLQSWNLRR
jgi:hypothetical protein